MSNKCSCNDIANKRDAWSVGMVEDTYWGTVYAWVSCSRCGAFWKTTARYKRHIAGAENFKEVFDQEKDIKKKILQEKINELDQQIFALTKRKTLYELRLSKLQREDEIPSIY